MAQTHIETGNVRNVTKRTITKFFYFRDYIQYLKKNTLIFLQQGRQSDSSVKTLRLPFPTLCLMTELNAVDVC